MVGKVSGKTSAKASRRKALAGPKRAVRIKRLASTDRTPNANRKASLLQERAYEEVRRLIVSGEASPGSFLSERRLGQQLGMSKTPVHAALERLESEGFVAISPQQGVVVRELSIQEIVEHYEMRQAIEAYIVRKLAGRLNPDQIKQLKASLAAQKQQLREESLYRAVELDVEFHLLLCRFSGNGQMIMCMEHCHARMQQVIVRTLQREPVRQREALSEHAAIVDAIIEGDGDHAARLMADHLETGKQINLLPLRL